MQINLIPDSSVSSAPAGFIAAVQAAANIYDQDFPGNYTVNITYGWGTYDNQVDSELTTPNNGIGSIGGVIGYTDVNYATVKSWLTAGASLSDQKTAVASLPASNTALPGNANTFFVSSAQEKALGQFSGNNSAIDGSIGFNDTDASNSNFEGLALCEIGHALGWYTEYYTQTQEPTILDLFRYSSPGNRDWTAGQSAYFSINGGTTDVANFATSYDYTLFTNLTNDPFCSPVTNSTLNLTSLDTEVLNVIGFGTQSHVAPTVFAVSSVSVPENQSIAGSSLISSITNPSNDSITLDIFKDDGGGTGYFTVDGVRQADGVWIYPPSSSSVVKYFGGTSPGTDTLEVGIYDYTTNSYYYSSTTVAATTTAATTTAPVRNDFNGDDFSDLLWQNANGQPAVWEMNGTSVISAAVLANPGTSWRVIGAGDFNGDGKADVLWQNADGTPAIWEMNGTSTLNAFTLPNPGTSWHVIGAGDFNGDGKADILWQNTDGTPAIWEMNGSTIINAFTLPAPPPSWRVISAGDFNGDGKADILWQNTDGTPAIWEMNGSTIVNAFTLPAPPPSWHVIGAGDFNGDGKSDILWQNTDGTPAIWEMNGSTIINAFTLPAPPPSWHVIGSGDYNGDGKSDILWQNTDGTPSIWEMNGTSIITAVALIAPPASWHLEDDGPIPADAMLAAISGSAASAQPNGSPRLSAPDILGSPAPMMRLSAPDMAAAGASPGLLAQSVPVPVILGGDPLTGVLPPTQLHNQPMLGIG